MKKIIFILPLIAAGVLGWKYLKNPERKPTAPEQAIDATVNYVPNAIERKNAMENSINDNMTKENERLQKALIEIE